MTAADVKNSGFSFMTYRMSKFFDEFWTANKIRTLSPMAVMPLPSLFALEGTWIDCGDDGGDGCSTSFSTVGWRRLEDEKRDPDMVGIQNWRDDEKSDFLSNGFHNWRQQTIHTTTRFRQKSVIKVEIGIFVIMPDSKLL